MDCNVNIIFSIQYIFHLNRILHVHVLQSDRVDVLHAEAELLAAAELLVELDVAEADRAAVLEPDREVEGVDRGEVEPHHQVRAVPHHHAANLGKVFMKNI